MPAPPPKAQPAPPFANRELNGEVLLEELSELRTAQVHQKQLNDCVVGLRELTGVRASEAGARIKQLAEMPFSVRFSPRKGQDLFVCHANPRNLEDSLDPTLDELTVRRYLQHLDAAAVAFGQYRPAARQRAKNRRIEIVLYPTHQLAR